MGKVVLYNEPIITARIDCATFMSFYISHNQPNFKNLVLFIMCMKLLFSKCRLALTQHLRYGDIRKKERTSKFKFNETLYQKLQNF